MKTQTKQNLSDSEIAERRNKRALERAILIKEQKRRLLQSISFRNNNNNKKK